MGGPYGALGGMPIGGGGGMPGGGGARAWVDPGGAGGGGTIAGGAGGGMGIWGIPVEHIYANEQFWTKILSHGPQQLIFGQKNYLQWSH